MTMRNFIVVIVFLSCWYRISTVSGLAAASSDSTQRPTISSVQQKSTAMTNTSSTASNNSNICETVRCAAVTCEHTLPAIPSEGICCPRCCNTSECPLIKCATYFIPANFSAGECCGHCGPATDKPTVATKKPKSTTPKTTTERSASSSSEEEDCCESESSTEESCEDDIPPFPRKPNSYSRLIRLLTETLVQLRRDSTYRSYELEED